MVDDVMTWLIEIGGKPILCQRKTDAMGKPLTERSGRHFDTSRHKVLGVSRSLAMKLPELLQIVDRQFVSCEIQQGIQQHRTMSGRQNKPIAIEPMRVRRTMSEEL